MTVDDDRVRFLCLFDELETSRGLLKSGFGHLQEMDMGSTFYHLPHQLLASGLERLMKCYIAAVRKGRDGAYPDRAAMRLLGHDLESLVETICTEHYGGTQRPLVQEDLEFITTDTVLNDCGTLDYRRSVEILKRDDDSWVERSEQEIKAEGWPTIAVSKGEFDGEWPFRCDCVTVECRDRLFYVVNIGGYDFALNGAARSKFRLPFVHEAGVAVLGKSVGPFIDMAALLSP